jgi:hypothetical protein
MAAASIPTDRKSVRLALVQQHVRLEDEHPQEGVTSIFDENEHFQDEAWGENYAERDGVRWYYE